MSVRTVYITENGIPKTGLSPTWHFLRNAASGVDIAPQPTIVELGGGHYKFTANVPVGDNWIGTIDAGVTITNNTERYIPVTILRDKDCLNTLVTVTPLYDASSDVVEFIVAIFVNGVLQTTPSSASVVLYDTTHIQVASLTVNIQTNGVFVLVYDTPTLVAGAGYYAVATVTIGSNTFSSMESCITLA